ncbi:proline-rich extensin-like protein EPR1 [Drosophila grimshawi]|uniref:GH15096 n=1 Tax=Drosophila grimshawi TaxID=7222 RepID=B4IYV1_DROGR|nr:proline-rich extensin-like protein EPR1 [Drosophila grimshawi]EDV96638.1 GH15096 [Drosophila grimshawi]
MFGASGFLMALCALLCLHAGAGLRFPGPRLQRQEAAAAAAAPYPPAGLMPDPPFELPTEEAADFPQPDLTYGPPEEQPELTYGPPDEVYGPPDEVYGPPDGPPAIEELPDQTYGPPELPTSSTAQSAATINLASLRPQLQFVLPLVQRFTAFRQLVRPLVQRRPAKLTARPQRRRPAKIINRVNAAFPATQLTLPFVERRIPFRAFNSERLILNAPLQRKPAKLQNRPTIAQFTPAIRKPIYSGGRIIAYSDQVQNW